MTSTSQKSAAARAKSRRGVKKASKTNKKAARTATKKVAKKAAKKPTKKKAMAPKAASERSPQDALVEEWVGPWALKPDGERDRRAADLVRASIKFTKSGSFISPVAVAAIDILGIKSLLCRMSLAEVAEKFVEPFYDLTGPLYEAGLLSDVNLEKHGFRRTAGIYAVSISDTILLMRRPDWELGDCAIAEAQAVVELSRYVCRVIKINSMLRVPLRAAIAFGECLISVGDTRSLLGMPTGEASAWERQQEWIGGMLTPSAVVALRDGAEEAKKINGGDFKPAYPNALISYPIPLKPNCPELPKPEIALNWITSMTPGLAGFARAVIPDEPGDELPEDIRRKHRNTRAFAQRCESAPIDTHIEF
jgi:hypothetical protein